MSGSFRRAKAPSLWLSANKPIRIMECYPGFPFISHASFCRHANPFTIIHPGPPRYSQNYRLQIVTWTRSDMYPFGPARPTNPSAMYHLLSRQSGYKRYLVNSTAILSSRLGLILLRPYLPVIARCLVSCSKRGPIAMNHSSNQFAWRRK